MPLILFYYKARIEECQENDIKKDVNMKKVSKKITSLGKRTKIVLPPENTSFARAFSVISPILIYYVVSMLLLYASVYFIQWISTAGGGLESVVSFLRANSLAVSTVIKVISMLVACGVLIPAFLQETPVFTMPKGYGKDFPALLILGATAAIGVNVIFSLLKITSSSEAYTQVANNQFSLPVWAGILVYGIVSPVAEEIVFRGLVYNRMRRQFPFWVAFVGSAFFFGIYHGNWVQAAYGFILGLMITWMYERYGSFLVPVLLHSAANSCVYLCMQIPVLKEFVMSMAGLVIIWITMGLAMLYILRKKKDC